MGSVRSYAVVKFCTWVPPSCFHVLSSGGFHGRRSGQIRYSSHPVEEWEKVIWTTTKTRNQWLHFEDVFAKHRVRILGIKGSIYYFLLPKTL